jgi:DNA-binding transcriptional ArsR family regulator
MTELKNATRRGTERTGGLVRPGLTSRPLPAVELDPRTSYDFLISSCADCGELVDLLPEDREWVVRARAEVATRPEPCDESCSAITTELFRILLDRPQVRTAADLVAAVDEMSEGALLECLFGELLDMSEMPEVARAARLALDGDEAAYAVLQKQLEQFKGHPVLNAPMAEIARHVRSLLHDWLPYYEQIEGRIEKILQRDVASRKLEDAADDPIGFVEHVTNGIRVVPEARTRRIILSPTYFGRPYNSCSRVGEIQFIGYPVADASLEAAGGATPPGATLRLYRALGDETRLRVLRLLVEHDHYLTELANELGLSKPTMSHHLAQLRSAGLITTTEQGNLTYYTLRRDRVEEAGPELGAYLARK